MDKEKNTPTPESVWALLQEVIQLQKQNTREQAERDAQYKLAQEERDVKYKLAQEERDRKREERDAQYKLAQEERDAQLKREQAARDAQYKLAQEERDRKQAERNAEAAARGAALDARLDKLAKEVSGISNNNGYMAEEHFFTALQNTMTFAGVKYDSIFSNVHGHKGKLQDEFDIMMVNGTSVALIEVKYRVHQNIFEDGTLPTKKVQNFKALFPKYADMKIYLGIASMSFNKKTIQEARKLGIGIIMQKGDSIEFDTDYVKAY